MALQCERCQGAAEPAAQTRIIEYEGQTLHCLALVSSCMVCGHRWEDEKYEAENLLFAEQARAAVSSRPRSSRDPLVGIAPRVQRTTMSQSH